MQPQEIAVAGAIGSVAGVKRDDGKPARAVTEVPVGEGGVTAWLLCCLSPSSTVTVFFEVTSSHAVRLHFDCDSQNRTKGLMRCQWERGVTAWLLLLSQPPLHRHCLV